MSAATDLLQTVKIKVGLLADHRVSRLDVNVDVEGGVARLSGVVQTEEQKLVAEEIAGAIEGVVEVENEIVVAPSEEQMERLEEQSVAVLPPDDRRLAADNELADRVRDAVSRDSRIKSRGIRVRADGDTILLYGVVERIDEFTAVEEIASSVPGVRKVINDIEIGEAEGPCFGY